MGAQAAVHNVGGESRAWYMWPPGATWIDYLHELVFQPSRVCNRLFPGTQVLRSLGRERCRRLALFARPIGRSLRAAQRTARRCCSPRAPSSLWCRCRQARRPTPELVPAMVPAMVLILLLLLLLLPAPMALALGRRR